MEFIFNILEFLLCCGKIREKEVVHHRLHDYSASSSNRPLLHDQRVGSLESIKRSHGKHKVYIPLPLINSVQDDRSVHKQTQKFPEYVRSKKPTEKILSSDEVACLKKPILTETVVPEKPFKISHDSHDASSSVHYFHETARSQNPIKVSQDMYKESSSLLLIRSFHDQSAHEPTEKNLASDAARCLYKPKLSEKVGPKLPINESSSSLPLINSDSVHDQPVHKPPRKFAASETASSLNKPRFDEKAGSLKPIEISQSSHKASSPLALINSAHDQSAKNPTQAFLASDGSCVRPILCETVGGPIKLIEISSPPSIGSVHGGKLVSSHQICQPRKKKEMTVLGRQCGPKAAPTIQSQCLDPCSKISQVHDQSSSYNTLELPKIAEFLKSISQDEHKVSSPLPLIGSVHDQSPKKPQMKQPMVNPLPIAKMVGAVSNRRSTDINEGIESTGTVKISQEEKQSPLQSEAKKLPKSVQNTQISTNSLPSKLIRVKKSSEWFQSIEIEKPRGTSSSLVGSLVSNESDDELLQSRQMLRSNKYKLPIYRIPEHLKEIIEKDKKWADFLLTDVTLELHEEKAKKEVDGGHKSQVNKKVFVKFEIDSVRERRPYLLSRDFVFLKHSGRKSKRFEGSISRVMKSICVLAEFGDDFYSQYSPNDKYDVSFSFNRVCLKRCHQAIASAMDPSFHHLLFPGKISFDSLFSSYQNNIDDAQIYSVVRKITNMQGPSLYLINGPSRTQDIVEQAVLQILRNSPNHRILICTSRNRTCDALAAILVKKLPESGLFRANAAFRGFLDVDEEVIPISLYNGECFGTPSLSKLRDFRVVTSTYVSSFRLHSRGINAGHFTHIFLVEASCATEPETMIALANLVGGNTSVVISGCKCDSPPRVRSDIGRRGNGLKRSYFHRLVESI